MGKLDDGTGVVNVRWSVDEDELLYGSANNEVGSANLRITETRRPLFFIVLPHSEAHPHINARQQDIQTLRSTIKLDECVIVTGKINDYLNEVEVRV